MQEYIDEFTLANQIVMLRDESTGAIVLINHEEEGRFYESITHKSAIVIPSLKVATDLLSLVASRGIKGVIAAVQSRFKTGAHEAEFCPDAGDVASLLLKSSEFDKVILNVAGKKWIKAADEATHGLLRHASELASQLVEMATASGGVISSTLLTHCINWDDFSIDCVRFESLLKSSGKSNETSGSEVLQGLSCGHVALEIISASTCNFRPSGLVCNQTVSKQSLLQLLEVSFDCSDIERDSFFWRVKAWERRNREYPVFREWRTLDSFGLLWDQRYWESDLSLIKKHERDDVKLSLVKLDLDNFKNVNDKLNHTAGDDAIRLASRTIKSVMGGVGEVYRRGGDEFIIIVPDCDANVVDTLAEELRAKIQSAFLDWGREYGIDGPPTASIGIASMGVDASIPDLIRRVDGAQKMAKDLGKNRVYRSVDL